jgi:hypothetical protein
MANGRLVAFLGVEILGSCQQFGHFAASSLKGLHSKVDFLESLVE